MGMKMPTSVKVLGFLQALGVAIYVLLVGGFMWNMQHFFGNQPDQFWAPIMVLLLFITSAMICASIVFYKPITWFFIENKKKQALELVLHTTAWLFVFFAIILTLAIVV